MSTLKIYFLETRPRFLLLSLVVATLATAMAWASTQFRPSYAVLAFAGLLLLHISVNTLNDYFDYRSGIDLATQRTPFNGGSGFLPSGTIPAGGVLFLGIASFVLAVPIGIFFLFERGPLLLPFFILGGFFVLTYTPLLTRMGGGVAEFSAGLGLGALPVTGVFYVLTGHLTGTAVYASIPSGLLVANLLLLSEFPDTEANEHGGRKTLPIVIGKTRSAVLYAALSIGVYLCLILGVITGMIPPWTLLGCLTFPMALKAIAGAFSHDCMERLLPALRANVAVVLLTQLLVSVGFVLSFLT